MASEHRAPPARGTSRATTTSPPPAVRPASSSGAQTRRAFAIASGAALVAGLVAFAIISSEATSATLSTILLVATVATGALTVAFVLRGLWLAARSRNRPTRRSILAVVVASGITGYFTILQMIQAWHQLPLH